MNQTRPTLLRVCAAIALLEMVALIGLVVFNVVGGIRDSFGNVGLFVGGQVLWLILAAALAFIAWGLNRRAPRARTPFILAQAFALILAYPLVLKRDQWTVLGVLIGLVAVVGIGIALSRQAGLEFDADD